MEESENQKEKTNRILVLVDSSNLEYVCMNSAFSVWKKQYAAESSHILSPEETDQDNLPNILNFDSYRKILHNTVQKRLEKFEDVIREHFPQEISIAEGVDFIFTGDDRIHNNFRRKLYPEYKAQRKMKPKQFDVFTIKNYIEDVIFAELGLEDVYGYRFVKVEDCESDDIIATTMKMCDNYICRVIFSSDRDFLQIENVHQFDVFGNFIECGFKNKDHFIKMTPKKFLLWKILRGDDADNIMNVFEGKGPVKSYKLMEDKETLKNMLKESKEAAERYVLNSKLIDFKYIPKEIEDSIRAIVGKVLEDNIMKSRLKNDFDIENCIML